MRSVGVTIKSEALGGLMDAYDLLFIRFLKHGGNIDEG